MRDKDTEIKEAKIARKDQLDDAKESYEKQKKTLDKQRKEQLAALEEQEAKENEARERSRQRNAELQALHDQWEKEDREKKYAEQLRDLRAQMLGIVGITDDGLNTLTEHWSQYFGNLMTMATTSMEYMKYITSYSGSGTTGQTWPTISLPETMPGPPAPPTVGQAGQVSHLLANPGQMTSGVPQIPSVVTPKSGERREIDVKVTGDAMDPYIQRVMVNALLEIERNRGNV